MVIIFELKQSLLIWSHLKYFGMNSVDREQHTREIIHSIRRIVQAGEHYSKELEKTFGVSTPQLACIQVLREQGPLPLSKIAKQIMVNSSTVTGIIDRLEKKDLVARIRDPRDRRMITIELTNRGNRLAENAPPLIPHGITQGLKSLPEEDFNKVVFGLHKLASLLDSAAEVLSLHS